MTTDELRDDIQLELHRMENVVEELEALENDVAQRSATAREEAATGQFLASFYMGIENILKRIVRYHGVEVPQSEQWHVDLFRHFTSSENHPRLPVLFPEPLAQQLRPYRRFRHVVHHTYGIELEWARMAEGVQRARPVFERFREEVNTYLSDFG